MTEAKNRWNPEKVYEFPQWLRNDVPKFEGKPGYNAVAERVDLAADLLDAVIARRLDQGVLDFGSAS